MKTTSLKFICYNCKFENTYPAIKDPKAEAGTTIVKRCTNCATPNRIPLPENYTTELQVIFRGLKQV